MPGGSLVGGRIAMQAAGHGALAAPSSAHCGKPRRNSRLALTWQEPASRIRIFTAKFQIIPKVITDEPLASVTCRKDMPKRPLSVEGYVHCSCTTDHLGSGSWGYRLNPL